MGLLYLLTPIAILSPRRKIRARAGKDAERGAPSGRKCRCEAFGCFVFCFSQLIESMDFCFKKELIAYG